MRPLWLLLLSTVLFLLSGAAFGARRMKGFIINKQDCCHLYLGFFFIFFLKSFVYKQMPRADKSRHTKTFRKSHMNVKGSV